MALPSTTTTTAAIKRELPATSSVTNGLARLTPARDLTLGGRGGGGSGAKKVFLPNLNAVRNKNSNVKTSKDVTAARGRRGGKGERGARGGGARGRGGNANSSLIQTSGVFSEGAGAVNIRKSFGNSSGHERVSDENAVSQLRKPVLTKSTQKFDVKEEAARLRNLLGDSDEDNIELDEDNKTDVAQVPIKLNEANWKIVKSEIKLEKSDESTPAAIVEDSIAIAQHLQSLHVKQQKLKEPPKRCVYPASVDAFLNITESQLFLMQIPDTLPCVTDDEPPEQKVSPANTGDDVENREDKTPETERTNFVLKELEEGQIGKLVRYKSGKIKLVLGETRFDLDMGMETGFLQELMSISSNREERNGNMINLGPIQAKLNATPDWEYLFEQQEATARGARQS